MSCSSLVITEDGIRTHNELAEEYLPKPGTILVAWFHPCFYTSESHCLNILRATSYLMCLLHCQETMFSLPTSCVSFGKLMVSKGNQLDRGSRPLRKTMEHIGKPIIQFSKQRKWENHVENHPQVEGSRNILLESGQLLPHIQDVRLMTHDTSCAFDLCQNLV